MIFKKVLALLLIVGLCSCTSGGGSSDGEDSGSSDSSNRESGTAATNCGVVKNDRLINPVSESDGEVVQISRAANQNALILNTSTGGQILIKLHALDASPEAIRNTAISYINGFAGKPALLVRAGKSCPAVLAGGGLGELGQLILSSGVSLSEELVSRGFATPTSSDACSSNLISSCYTALQESNPQSAGELNSFLWKPVADSDGNLAIHTGPFGTTVSVNGEIGRNQGGGNGFGSLARFSKPGCAYSNPKIIVRSSNGLPYSVAGQTTLSVGNPCGRHCLVGGQIVACSK
jgi:hypothetical protein